MLVSESYIRLLQPSRVGDVQQTQAVLKVGTKCTHDNRVTIIIVLIF